MVHWELTRTEAEFVLELLEKQTPENGEMASNLVQDLKETLGMIKPQE